jgi:hypothetical protein
MKVRTNLRPEELALVGEGLKKLAKSQVEGKDEIVLENNAEEELVRRSDHLFDTMLNSLQDEVSNILRSTS